MKKIVLIIATFCILLSANSQVTISLAPDKDNSIYSESNNSNGTGALYSGETCSGNSRRALLHFDVAGNLPAGATITSVTLTLNVQQISGSATTNNYNLHELSTDWGEGTSFGTGTGGPASASDATWNSAMFGSTLWTTPGGDFGAAVATTSLTPTMGNFSWTSAGMLTNVQNWHSSPASNFGWILIGDELSNCGAREFGSKETGTAPELSITYTCATPPTATCKNATVYLNSLGQYTLTGVEVDNGSLSNCGGPLTYSLSQTDFDCADINLPSTEKLILTAIFDGNLTGGLPKGVEVFAASDIADLSIYGLGSATNGGGTDGVEFTFPAVSVTAGTYLYIASESTGFNSFFGFMPDYVDTDMGVNGDDAVELFENGVVIDVFGEQTWTSGPHPWFYSDGFAYRNVNTGPDGSTFVIGNWTMSGVNALDPALTNGTAPIPVPIGTFTTVGSVPVTLTVTDQFLNSSTCDAGVFVFDTLGPNMDCIGATAFNLDGTGNLTLTAGDIDDGTIDGCGIMSMMISQTDFDCSDLGLNQITLTAVDIYGNSNECVANILIEQVGGISITIDQLNHVSCNGGNDGSVLTTITGGSAPYIIDWDNDGTGDNDDNEDLTGLSAGVFILTATDQSGCVAESTVTLNEPSQLDIIADITNVSCPDQNDGIIDITVSGGTPGYTYDWDNDGFGDNDDTQDLTNISFGAYNVVVTDANGCTAGFLAEVMDAAPVDVSVTQTGFTLTANATGGTYQWIVCPSNVNAGSTSATFNPTADGDYAVIVTDGNGCSDTSACFTIFGLSTSEFNTPTILVYPNPATDFVTVHLTEKNSNTAITVTDVNGRVVITKNAVNQKEIIDVSALENGIYFLTVFSADTTYIVKLKIIR